ncbi:hypothetical protein RDI58_022373 [Solanum bulbocastanum]|uniref:Uncharacterized protein n=1 Tax=Solanum bulbocastanum TaxID=147425 RepID=A0AAN8Y5K9_SOLBU
MNYFRIRILGETTTSQIAKSKEARVTELEAILGNSSNGEEETIESEFEGLFKQKIEVEVQYLALS